MTSLKELLNPWNSNIRQLRAVEGNAKGKVHNDDAAEEHSKARHRIQLQAIGKDNSKLFMSDTPLPRLGSTYLYLSIFIQILSKVCGQVPWVQPLPVGLIETQERLRGIREDIIGIVLLDVSYWSYFRGPDFYYYERQINGTAELLVATEQQTDFSECTSWSSNKALNTSERNGVGSALWHQCNEVEKTLQTCLAKAHPKDVYCGGISDIERLWTVCDDAANKCTSTKNKKHPECKNFDKRTDQQLSRIFGGKDNANSAQQRVAVCFAFGNVFMWLLPVFWNALVDKASFDEASPETKNTRKRIGSVVLKLVGWGLQVELSSLQFPKENGCVTQIDPWGLGLNMFHLHAYVAGVFCVIGCMTLVGTCFSFCGTNTSPPTCQGYVVGFSLAAVAIMILISPLGFLSLHMQIIKDGWASSAAFFIVDNFLVGVLAVLISRCQDSFQRYRAIPEA